MRDRKRPEPHYATVTDADFDALAQLRIAAMRDSLQNIGRFDPGRARDRLRATFAPRDTHAILLDGVRIGFYTARRHPNELRLDHLYILPAFQGVGVGSQVLDRIKSEADALGLPIRLSALRDSPSNDFYVRHGFVAVAEETWDIHYERLPQLVDS